MPSGKKRIAKYIYNTGMGPRTTFEPAFAFTQVKAFRTVRTCVTPATVVAIRALEAWWRISKHATFVYGHRTIFEKVTRRFFRIGSQGRQLIWGQHVVMRVFTGPLHASVSINPMTISCLLTPLVQDIR